MKQALRWARLGLVVAAVCLAMVWLGAPSPPLFGGLVGAMALALSPLETPAVPLPLFRIGQSLIGLTVAAHVDFDSLQAFASDWPAIVLVTVATLVISSLAGLLLRRHDGVDNATAVFASIAGGASGMTALADDLGADARIVSVIQYLRVLMILITLPAVVGFVFAPNRDDVAGAATSATIQDYAFVVIAVALGLAFGNLARIPSPAVLGTLIVGIVLVLTPVFEGSVVPVWVQSAGFLLIGIQVGLRFTRRSLVAIRKMLPTALVMILIVIAACAGLSVVLADLTGVSDLDAYLATTPGGLPAVLATATETSDNVTFVTSVQLMRLILVLLLAPLIAKLVLGRRDTPR